MIPTNNSLPFNSPFWWTNLCMIAMMTAGCQQLERNRRLFKRKYEQKKKDENIQVQISSFTVPKCSNYVCI